MWKCHNVTLIWVYSQSTLHKQLSFENTSMKLVIDGISWQRGYDYQKKKVHYITCLN